MGSLLCAALAFAQPQPDKQAGVFGAVVNSVTGAPLPRVHVILGGDGKDAQTYGAMTTTDGKFSITGIVPGSYTLTTERVGFSMPTDPEAPENRPLLLRPGERQDDLRLTLVPAGAILGRVTNADGDPVQGVDVQAESAVGISGDVAGTTDAKGHYRIGGLSPGRYRVEAIPENHYTPAEQRTDGTVDVEDAPTYYPGSLTFRQGARTVVTAGNETSGVDIQLARVPIVAVSGKVEGGPVGGFNAQFWIAQQGGRGWSTQGIKPDGTFRLWRLYPGKYEISVMWQAPGGRDFQSAPAEFEVAGANIEHVSLRIIPPANIAGHLEFQDESAKPRSGTAAKLTLMNVGLRGGAKSAEIAADGSFQVSQLRAGRYRVVPSWNGVYIASMQLGPVAIDGSLLDLMNGAAGGELSVRVSSATGSVAGNVTDDKGPASGARVVLAFDGDGGGVPPRFATAGAGGAYSFEGVAPGKYKLLAMQDGDSDSVTQPDALEDYGDPESIVIQPGEKLSHDLKRHAPDDR